MSWTIILGIFAGTFTARAAGPMLLGRRQLPRAAEVTLVAVAVAMLAALVAVGTLASGERLEVDARLGGVLAGGAAAVLRAPFVVIILVAALVAAGLRATGIG